MPTLSIPASIPADVAERLAERAASHGRSLEAEAGEILASVLAPKITRVPGNMGDAIRAIVDPLGGVNLDIPLRHPGSRPIPTFD
jgi:antitoxin FitA